MNKLTTLIIAVFTLLPALSSANSKTMTTKFTDGTITIKPVAKNAVRIQYTEGEVQNLLPEWIYIRDEEVPDCDLKVKIDKKRHTLYIKNVHTSNTLLLKEC